MSNNICPSCFGRQYNAGRCGSCGFYAGEYKPERTALSLGNIAGNYRIGVMKFNSRQSQVYTAVHNETSAPAIIEEFFPAKVAGRAPNTAEVTLASGDPETVQRYQQACLLIEASSQKRPLKRIETFRANNTVYSVFEPAGTVSVAAQCEMMSDNPYYFRDQNGMPMMTINALPIPGMPQERAYDSNQYASNGPNTQPSEASDNYPETVVQEAARRNRKRKILIFGSIGAALAVIIAAVALIILPPSPPPPPVETTVLAEANTPTPVPAETETGLTEMGNTEAGDTENTEPAGEVNPSAAPQTEESNSEGEIDPNKSVIPSESDIMQEITEDITDEINAETEASGESGEGTGKETTGTGDEEPKEEQTETTEEQQKATEEQPEITEEQAQPEGGEENQEAEAGNPEKEQHEPEESKKFLSKDEFIEQLQIIPVNAEAGFDTKRLKSKATKDIDSLENSTLHHFAESMPIRLLNGRLFHNSSNNKKTYVVTEKDGRLYRVPIYNITKAGEYEDEGALLSFRTWADLGEGLPKETRVCFPITEFAKRSDEKLDQSVNNWLEWENVQIGLELSDGQIRLTFSVNNEYGTVRYNYITVVLTETTPEDETPAEEKPAEETPAEAAAGGNPEEPAAEPAEEPAPEAPVTETAAEPTEEPAPEEPAAETVAGPTEEPTEEPTSEAPEAETTEEPAPTDNVKKQTGREINTPNGKLSITTNGNVTAVIVRMGDGTAIRMTPTALASGNYVWTMPKGISIVPGNYKIEYQMANSDKVTEAYQMK